MYKRIKKFNLFSWRIFKFSCKLSAGYRINVLFGLNDKFDEVRKKGKILKIRWFGLRKKKEKVKRKLMNDLINIINIKKL